MTLIAVQRKSTEFSISGDTRYSLGGSYFDLGIKVTSVNVRVLSPYDQGQATVDYSHDIAMAVTGSVNAASVMRAYINEALHHLQYTPGYTDFSFEGLVKFILRYYERLVRETAMIFRESGIAEVILAGFCPLNKRIKCFHLFSETSDNGLVGRYREVLQDYGTIFFGSGKDLADQLFALDQNASGLKIVKQVIDSRQVPSVGGDLQYGAFAGKDFKVKGLILPDPLPGDPDHHRWCLWGIDHYETAVEIDDGGFIFNYSFVMHPDLTT